MYITNVGYYSYQCYQYRYHHHHHYYQYTAIVNIIVTIIITITIIIILGDGAFNGCSSLTTVTIPTSVTYIGAIIIIINNNNIIINPNPIKVTGSSLTVQG
jgi:hypothetical protein